MKKITTKSVSNDMEEKLSPDVIRALNNQYANPSRPPYLLILLVLALAAFSAYLYSQVQSLKKTANTAGTQQVNNNQPQRPPQNLGAMPPLNDKDHILGNKDANIVLVEYSDFECPFCKSFHPTMQQIKKDYGDKVAWVYRHYPLPFHQNAQKEAEASECAFEQGGNDAFWKFGDKIFERTTSNGNGFALSDLGPLAAEVGLDQIAFQQCLDSGKYANHVKEDMDGGSKAGIQGTPGTIIIAKNGKKDLIGGALPLQSAKQQIDALLQ